MREIDIQGCVMMHFMFYLEQSGRTSCVHIIPAIFKRDVYLPKIAECTYLLSTEVCTFISDLPYKVKTQYVHLYSIAATSIKHKISLQSTPVLKSCIYMCLI